MFSHITFHWCNEDESPIVDENGNNVYCNLQKLGEFTKKYGEPQLVVASAIDGVNPLFVRAFRATNAGTNFLGG